MWLLPGKAEQDVTFPAGEVSAELRAAQERLAQLQAKSRAVRLAASAPVPERDDGRAPAAPSPQRLLAQLPSHLGWGSMALTAVCRPAAPKHHKAGADWQIEAGNAAAPPSISPSPHLPVPTATIKLYPDIAFGLFQQELTAPGRIWLLLRHLDGKGQGWLSLNSVRTQLTQKESRWQVCGWRQLRNLLNQGEGIFWTRDDGRDSHGREDKECRLWLRSAANVASALQVPRLVLPPVALPVSVLVESIGQVRAHLYASFHSSRAGRGGGGKTTSSPIARETIGALTQVIPRTQRRYEKMAGVSAQQNFAIGGSANAETVEYTAWRHGRATFRLNDKKGIQGKSGQRYVAWQLPNSYAGPHRLQPKGQQKQINQALSDLFMQGMTGNGQCRPEKRFYGHGRAAAQAYNRGISQDIYWYDGRVGVWYCYSLEQPSLSSGRK